MSTVPTPRGPFFEVTGATAILRCRGVFRQCGVFRRGDALYAKHGTGFLRLYATGTSVPHVTLDELIMDEPTHADTFGRLSVAETPKPLPQITRTKRIAP